MKKAFKQKRAFRVKPDSDQVEKVSIEFALKKVKEFNREFCHDKSDDELIRQMQISPIYTNLSKYWIEK